MNGDEIYDSYKKYLNFDVIFRGIYVCKVCLLHGGLFSIPIRFYLKIYFHFWLITKYGPLSLTTARIEKFRQKIVLKNNIMGFGHVIHGCFFSNWKSVFRKNYQLLKTSWGWSCAKLKFSWGWGRGMSSNFQFSPRSKKPKLF